MNKKHALICAIILNALALAAFISAFSLPDSAPQKIGITLTVFFIVFLIGGMSMLAVYSHKSRKEKIQAALNVRADFDEWLNKFQPFVRTGAKLIETSDKTFTKFGGLPLVFWDFVWPVCGNRAIPFLLQIDFSEINADGKLTDFPLNGLLYLFADSDGINKLNSEDGGEEYAQGRTFQLVFSDKRENLKPAVKPRTLDIIYKEFFVCADLVKSYPDVDECKEASEIYNERPFSGIVYDEMRGENMDASMIGGWATYVQSSRLANGLNRDEWVLLMQIASADNDEKFMWGDNGTLYFYIRKEDLLSRRFENIKLDMQSY